MSREPEDDDLEVIDLEPTDEEPSRVAKEPRPSRWTESRPRPSRRVIVAALVLAALLVGAGGGYVAHRLRSRTPASTPGTGRRAPYASFAPGPRTPPDVR